MVPGKRAVTKYGDAIVSERVHAPQLLVRVGDSTDAGVSLVGDSSPAS
jgi:hypothetical protein